MTLPACTALLLLVTASTLAAQTPPASARPDGIPKDWTRFTAGTAFSFWGPPDLKEEKVQGVDSVVARFASSALKIDSNYGWGGGLPTDARAQPTTLDRREAFLLRSDRGITLYVPKAADTRGLPNSPMGLQMTVTCDKALADQSLLLLQSIKFTAPPPTPDLVLTKAKDYVAANGIKLARGGNLEGWSLGSHWYRMRLWLSTDEGKSGHVFRNLLVSDAGTVIDPKTSYDQALNVITDSAGPAKDLPAYQRHIELYLQIFRPETTLLLHSTKDIARYEDHPLPKDLQTAVTAPWTYDFRPDEPHCVAYTYQQVGGIVERWDFTFQNGKIWRHETIKFPTPVGGAILYE